MGGFSIWHWLIVLVIVALIFGTKKLRNMGEDIGSAVKSFRKGLQDDETAPKLGPDSDQTSSADTSHADPVKPDPVKPDPLRPDPAEADLDRREAKTGNGDS